MKSFHARRKRRRLSRHYFTHPMCISLSVLTSDDWTGRYRFFRLALRCFLFVFARLEVALRGYAALSVGDLIYIPFMDKSFQLLVTVSLPLLYVHPTPAKVESDSVRTRETDRGVDCLFRWERRAHEKDAALLGSHMDRKRKKEREGRTGRAGWCFGVRESGGLCVFFFFRSFSRL